jgi:ligand-binding sensor domain-containing protein
MMINQAIWRALRFLFVTAFAIFVMPLSGFAGDVETLFDSPRLNTDRPFFSSLKIAPDGKTAWAGTQKTILRFTGAKRDEFRKESVAVFAESSCYNFKPLAFDAKGTLWVGLQCYKDAPLATFNGSAWTLVTRDFLPLPEYVKCVELMAFDKNNVMWLTTYSGLLRYDGKEWQLFSPENSPIPTRQISALNIDKNGAVWIGTNGGHIAKFDGTRWEVFKAGSTTNGLQYSSSNARSIKFDMNGVMYFTNYGGGAYRYASGKFKMIECSYGGGGYFEDVAFDAQNILWIANNRNSGKGRDPGLLRQDGKKCRSFKLPNNSGYWLEIDAAGNKWIASSGMFDANVSITLFREGGVKLAQ